MGTAPGINLGNVWEKLPVIEPTGPFKNWREIRIKLPKFGAEQGPSGLMFPELRKLIRGIRLGTISIVSMKKKSRTDSEIHSSENGIRGTAFQLKIIGPAKIQKKAGKLPVGRE